MPIKRQEKRPLAKANHANKMSQTVESDTTRDASTDYAVIMDQDEYIKTLRPIASPELTDASAGKGATKAASDLFVSLRGALT